MNPAELTAAFSSLGIAIAAMIAALGDTALATPVRAAFAAAGPLVVMLLTYVLHTTEQAKILAGGAVAAAKVQTAPPAPPTAEQMAAVVEQAMHALMGAQPPAS
jgi:hypothetical protein